MNTFFRGLMVEDFTVTIQVLQMTVKFKCYRWFIWSSNFNDNMYEVV